MLAAQRTRLAGAWLCAVWLAASLPTALAGESSASERWNAGIVRADFVFEKAPFPESHASTIVAIADGLVAAWFGGTEEKHPDVGIWVSLHDGSRWSAPREVATGLQADGKRYPCWNPVLHRLSGGPLLLFYKVGPSPSTWWGMLITSADGGRSWSPPMRLPDGIAGPIKNKPVELKDGRLLCGSSTEDRGWRVHMEWTSDQGRTWSRTDALNDGETVHAIQPTILVHRDGRLQILCRSRRSGTILSAFSSDLGKTWGELRPSALPNPNSGVDAVTLKDGRHLLVYNHTMAGRSPLNVALSSDGEAWSAALVLEDQPGEYSYPAAIQAPDGLVHITYTWNRKRIRHVVVDPAKLAAKPIVGGRWPE
jgi:predicted neuraminidase